MNISFEYPEAFLLLIALICFFRCKRSLKIYFSKTALLPKSYIKNELFAPIVFTLLVSALSYPFLFDNFTTSSKRGRDLVMVLDASGSMEFDLGEKSKFQTLIEYAKSFINKRFNDNIAIVVFGAFAYTAAPITYDLKALNFILDYLETGVAGNSTAIGDALMEAIKSIKKSNSKERVIILFTDGKHNAGKISPKEAVKEAKKLNIKIYTVGIGEDFDENLLIKIAKESQGEFFKAANKEDLEEIFKKLNILEPSNIRSGIYENKKPLFFIPLILALFAIFIRLKRLF